MPPPAPRVYYPRELLAPGYLRRGYGGTRKWPFSKEKAFREPGYQRGIRNAIRNPVYARPWRTAAARRLEEVEEMERAEEERRIFDAAQEEWDSAPVPEDVEADLSQVEAVQDALDGASSMDTTNGNCATQVPCSAKANAEASANTSVAKE